MKTEDWRGGMDAPAQPAPTRSLRPQDNPHVVSALEEYLAALEAGRAPNRSDFLTRHPEIAEALAECLDGLEFIRAAASRVREASRDGPEASADATPVHPAAPLGDFCLIREIGRGGMGVVYEAEQISLGRRVALKVLPFAGALDAKQLQRFKNEAHAAAQLHHTNIVPIFYVGSERGVHFYAMQFIEGQTLAAVIAELRSYEDLNRGTEREPAALSAATNELLTGPWVASAERVAESWATAPGPNPQSANLPTFSATTPKAGISTERSVRSIGFCRTVARLGVQAAGALEHAHEMGVVHRDIKPANLLIDSRGHLWIADFGLAQVQSDTKLTLTGDLVGTLRYMSPEQALAKRVPVDHRTDVYSLGVTLYELMTLEPAFTGNDRQELLRQVSFEEPKQPRRMNKAIPAELETIVLKAMEKNPADRYATAQELANDLERFLRDEPIRAKRPSLVLRARKVARRHQGVVGAALACLAVAVVVLAISNVLVIQEKNQKTQALDDRDSALGNVENAKKELEDNLYRQTIALAERHHSAGSIGLAEKLLNSELCPAARRGWEWHYLKGLCRENIPALPAESILFRLALSRDGNCLAAGGNDGHITVWDTQTWEKRSFRAHAGRVGNLAFSGNGRRLWSGGSDGSVHLWDLSSGERLAPFRVGWAGRDEIEDLAVSPDGRLLAMTGESHTSVWEVQTGRRIVELEQADAAIGSPLVFSPDGRLLVTGYGDLDIMVWDTSNWQNHFPLRGHGDGLLESVAFSSDGRILAAGGRRIWDDSDASDVIIWDLENRWPLHRLQGLGGGACSLAFSPDGRRLATGGCEDPTIKIWDVATGKETLTLRGHLETIFGLAFSPDGHRLYSASADHTVRIWDGTPTEIRTGQELRILRGHEGRVNSLAFTHNGRLVSGGMDRTVRLWDFSTGGEPRTLIRGASPVYAVAISPDGAILATGSFCGFQGPPERPELRIWDALTWQERLCLSWPSDDGGGVTSMAFSPDNRRLLLTTNYHPTVVDVPTGQPLLNLRGSKRLVRSVAFGSKSLIAWGGLDGEVMIWDEQLRQYAGPAIATVLPGSLWVRLVSTRNAFEIQPTQVLKGHDSRAVGVALAPDERRLASCGIDGVVKIWDREGDQWTQRFSLRLHLGAVHSVAFSPDGRRLASAGHDGTIRVWDVEAGQQVLELRGHTDSAYTVAYSPDGRFIASGSSDGTIRIWDAQGTKVRRSRADRDVKTQHNGLQSWHNSKGGRK